jgi:hypothetical protein
MIIEISQYPFTSYGTHWTEEEVQKYKDSGHCSCLKFGVGILNTDSEMQIFLS